MFRIYLLLLLVLCAGCCFADAPGSSMWRSLIFMVLVLSLLGIVTLSMVRLWLALLRKKLSYEAHRSELAIVLTTLSLLLLCSLAFGPIC